MIEVVTVLVDFAAFFHDSCKKRLFRASCFKIVLSYGGTNLWVDIAVAKSACGSQVLRDGAF